MAKNVLDLYKLYSLVVARGGLVQVMRNKQWQEIIRGLNLPTSITSAAFTLREQYSKCLLDLEIHEYNTCTKAEVEAAIANNRRDSTNRSFRADNSIIDEIETEFDEPSTESTEHTKQIVKQCIQRAIRKSYKSFSLFPV